MTETSSQKPQIKTSVSFLDNISPESPKHKQITQSPLTYTSLKDNNISSPTYNNNDNKKKYTFSSIFSFSRSNSASKHYRSETYQENDEFTSNGCFCNMRTLGSKIKYKMNDIWTHAKNSCKPKKKRADQDKWKSRAKTLKI